MKTTTLMAVLLTVALACTSCGSTSSTTSNPLAGLTSQSAAYTSGQSAGTALRALYTQYKTNGKIDMTNHSTLTNILTLTNSYQTLKNAQKGSGAYTDFTKGLMLGSSNLVTPSNTETVMDNLSNVLGKLDTSTITNALQQGTTAASTAVNNAVNNAVNDAVEKGTTAVANATTKGSEALANATAKGNAVVE
ncbi:MAG: hypothetical protein J6P99_04980, partial [Paludibacteraceae bacterium]|nr:hypothetical protein [Paludibacteraceae bacterium]